MYDIYPCKNGAQLWVHRESDAQLDAIHESPRQEVDRLTSHRGQPVMSHNHRGGPEWARVCPDLTVTAGHVHSHLLQPWSQVWMRALVWRNTENSPA